MVEEKETLILICDNCGIDPERKSKKMTKEVFYKIEYYYHADNQSDINSISMRSRFELVKRLPGVNRIEKYIKKIKKYDTVVITDVKLN